ncbi:DUF1080 domain-containing protein [Prosthecobacter sp. SYSU 5D2]|uniref:3-keto-disaccharide hydrolase n=1 Tax=Prosthecobacter sp. SYSU 5D2 TaxID=3134134 RepID=UPI0031FEAE3C
MKASLLVLLLALGVSRLMAADAVSLFDGKSLAGWTGQDGAKPGAGWVVVDGAIHLNGEKGGNLLSEKEYTNFDLSWEWKVEEGGNNGIKYWVTKINNKEWLGIEYQMIDDKKHPDGMKGGGTHSTASFYDIQAPAEDKPMNPPGEWNTSRVVAQDGKLQHYLNGKLVGEADTASEDWKTKIAASKFSKKEGFAPGKGRIMLTDHHDKVWIRNIQIVEK